MAWLGTLLQLSGAAALALHLRFAGYGFVAALAGNGLWFAIAFNRRDHALAVTNGAFAVLAAIGVWCWLA